MQVWLIYSVQFADETRGPLCTKLDLLVFKWNKPVFFNWSRCYLHPLSRKHPKLLCCWCSYIHTPFHRCCLNNQAFCLEQLRPGNDDKREILKTQRRPFCCHKSEVFLTHIAYIRQCLLSQINLNSLMKTIWLLKCLGSRKNLLKRARNVTRTFGK